MARAKKSNKKDTGIILDRRALDERRDIERREKDEPFDDEQRTTERRKVQRRRQIDPTTCERDYSTDEIEFMCALDEYKRANGRMFPTCSEILEVVRDLGYERHDSSDERTEADTSPISPARGDATIANPQWQPTDNTADQADSILNLDLDLDSD